MSQRKRSTQAELSRILGVNRSTVSTAKRHSGFPEPDRDNLFEIYAACVWWFLNKEGGTPRYADRDEDEIYSDADSPNLERLRKIRADKEEVLLGKVTEELMEVDRFRQEFGDALMPYRSCAEAFRRQGMDEAFEMLQEATDEVVRNLADGFDITSGD